MTTSRTIGAGGVSVTTKGDLQGFSTVAARIPIGADDTTLIADAAEALGLKWAAAASAGWELIGLDFGTGTTVTVTVPANTLSINDQTLFVLGTTGPPTVTPTFEFGGQSLMAVTFVLGFWMATITRTGASAQKSTAQQVHDGSRVNNSLTVDLTANADVEIDNPTGLSELLIVWKISP